MSNPKLNPKRLFNLPVWVVLVAFVVGALVALFDMDGFVGWLAAMTLLVANVLWGLKLFADQKAAVKQLYQDKDTEGALALLTTKLPVPLWYLASLAVAVVFPFVWAVAWKVAMGLLVIGLILLVISAVKGSGTSNKSDSSA